MKIKILVLSFDLDWCEDEVLDYTLEKLIKKRVPATFFITHDTKILNKIRKYDFFELGIHPNFKLNSTHGNSYKNVLSHCMSIVPEAISVRSHGLHVSTDIISEMLKHGLKIESSIFMPNITDFQNFYIERNNKKILRIPFNWEDDYEFYQSFKKYKFENINHYKKLIMNFHPIHIYLNSNSNIEYEKYKLNKNYTFSKDLGSENMLDEIINEYLKKNIQIKNLKDFSILK